MADDSTKGSFTTDVLRRIDSSKDERTKWEAQVATNMGFAEGDHKTWWDEEGRQRFKEVADHEVWRTINLIPRALSVIVTRVTSNNPRWHPRKSGLENVSREEIDAANALLQDVWEGGEMGDYSMKEEMKLVIRNAFLQGGALVQIRHDDDADMPVVECFELWDVFSDPSAQKLRDKRWIYIALPKSVDVIKSNDKYDENLRKKISMDSKLAESGIKEGHMRRVTGERGTSLSTVMTYFCFDVEDDGSITHRVVVANSGKGVDGEEGVLLKEKLEHPDEDTPLWLSHIFDIYHPVMRGRFYERPEVSDWIDPQKSIDKIHSNIENYIDCFLQGKWIRTDESTEIPRAGTQGQILDAAPGELQNLELQPLPGTHFEYSHQNVTHFEQITGVHGESFGRQSGSAESGVALAQLQALDEQNSSDAVDNFKMFLQRVGLKVLFHASMNWNKTKRLYKYDSRTGEEKQLKVIGERFAESREESLSDNTTKIRAFKRLDIEIVIGQFFDTTRKREEIVQLLQSGWNPGSNPVIDRVVLDAYDIGIGREIVDELRSLENPEVMIAKGKAAKIASGQQVEVVFSDPHAFLQSFYAGAAEKALEEGDQNAATLLNQQASRHGAHLQQGIGGVGSPQAPLQNE